MRLVMAGESLQGPLTGIGQYTYHLAMAREEFDRLAGPLGLVYKGYFLFVSTIEPRKNLDRLLDAYLAYRTVAGAGALPLIVSGLPGWKSKAIHARLTQLQKNGAVRYLGYTEQRLLPALFAGARVLLYPSLYEGFGLPVLEAMQCGAAVMTSRDSAMAEFADTAVKLVDASDTGELKQAITKSVNDDALVDALANRGRARAGQFSWQRCADQTFQTYTKVAA